jgi:hypothetical protein
MRLGFPSAGFLMPAAGASFGAWVFTGAETAVFAAAAEAAAGFLAGLPADAGEAAILVVAREAAGASIFFTAAGAIAPFLGATATGFGAFVFACTFVFCAIDFLTLFSKLSCGPGGHATPAPFGQEAGFLARSSNTTYL